LRKPYKCLHVNTALNSLCRLIEVERPQNPLSLPLYGMR